MESVDKMTEDKPDRTQLEEDRRIDALQERIDKATLDEAERTKARKSEVDDNYRLGNRVLAELIGGIGGGALIGWLLDRLFDTTPWLLLAFMFLGIVVAFRNIWKISSNGPK